MHEKHATGTAGSRGNSRAKAIDAVRAAAAIFSATRRFINAYRSALGTSSVREVNGLARKKKNTPQKSMPPAFWRFKNMEASPCTMF